MKKRTWGKWMSGASAMYKIATCVLGMPGVGIIFLSLLYIIRSYYLLFG